MVERKGVHWFITNVLPQLKTSYLYLVIGKGKEKERIKEAIKVNKLENKVYLLEGINDETLNTIYSSADLFIMPNIPVRGDMEGFGMVLLEAGSAGLYSIASDLEGIKDAVIDSVTGSLIKPYDKEAFIQAIEDKTNYDKNEITNQIKEKFSWEKTRDRYLSKIL